MKRLAWGAVFGVGVVLLGGCGAAADLSEVLAERSLAVSASQDASLGEAQEGTYSDSGEDLPVAPDARRKLEKKSEAHGDEAVPDACSHPRIDVATHVEVSAGESVSLTPRLACLGSHDTEEVPFSFELEGERDDSGTISEQGVFTAPDFVKRKTVVRIVVSVPGEPSVREVEVKIGLVPGSEEEK